MIHNKENLIDLSSPVSGFLGVDPEKNKSKIEPLLPIVCNEGLTINQLLTSELIPV